MEVEMAVVIDHPAKRLATDLNNAAKTLGLDEVRFLVDMHYEMQEERKRAGNQSLALSKANEPNSFISWMHERTEGLENEIKAALAAWCCEQPICRWSLSIPGIGPVISAGLCAHIDIEKAPTVGHIWRFAGLDPTVTWGTGQKRPWNARLKTLQWKIGESFVKVSNNEKDIYGKVYAERKLQEQARNEAGAYAEIAKEILARGKLGHDTEAYKAYAQGKLPPAHIHARAKRYAVKLFLAHWHAVSYELRFGTEAPKPYVIEHGGHTHFIAPPNWPM